MFASQVTYLAGLWEIGVARGFFAADKGIEVTEGAGAVSISRNREGVDVIY